MTTGLSDIEKGRGTRHKQAEPPPLMTRAQLVPFLNQNGIPITESTLAKLAAPKVNRGPPIAAWWGKRPLHEPEASLKWARSLLRDGPRDIAAQGDA